MPEAETLLPRPVAEHRPAGGAGTADPVQRVALAILVFALGEAKFGLLAQIVREITRATALTALPKAPVIMEGVVNFRGTVVPVLDIRQRFRLPSVPLHPDQHFIVAQAGPRLVALRVDRTTDVVEVDERTIVSASGSVPGAEYVGGIAKLPDGLLVIHDLEQFLSPDEAGQVDTATAQASRPQA